MFEQQEKSVSPMDNYLSLKWNEEKEPLNQQLA